MKTLPYNAKAHFCKNNDYAVLEELRSLIFGNKEYPILLKKHKNTLVMILF